MIGTEPELNKGMSVVHVTGAKTQKEKTAAKYLTHHQQG